METIWITGYPGAGKTTVTDRLRGLLVQVDAYMAHQIVDIKALSQTLRQVGHGKVVVEGTPLNHGALYARLRQFGSLTTLFIDITPEEYVDAMAKRCADGTRGTKSCEHAKLSHRIIEQRLENFKREYLAYDPILVSRSDAKSKVRELSF